MAQRQDTNTNSGTRDFHVWFLPGTADWLREQIDRDATTVPAVIRRIVEEVERQAKKKGKG